MTLLRLFIQGRQTALALAVLTGAMAVQADPAVLRARNTLGEDKLAELRGGFDNGQGLQASFGIERSVAVNGTMVVSQSILIPDLSRISTAQAEQLHSMLGGVTIVRTGPDNVLAPAGAGALAGATVIQNSLDGQTFKSLTVINATTNSLGALQAINAAASLRNALMSPALPRP